MTDPKIVYPESFGATITPTGAPAPPAAVCAANTAAFKAAFASLGGGAGIVQGSIGIYYVAGGAFGPQASYQALDGQGAGLSQIIDTTTGLTIQHGPSGTSSTYVDHTRVRGWIIGRNVAPTCVAPNSDGSPVSPSDGSGSGSIGYLHRYTANAVISDVTIADGYVCYQENMTTSALVDILCVQDNIASGQTRYGVYSDCTGTPPAGDSVNGSSYKRFKTLSTGGLSASYTVYGAYVQATNGDARDQYWNESETGNCNYGLVIQATNSNLNWDTRINKCVHDGFGTAGVSIRNYSGGATQLTILEGWFTPFAFSGNTSGSNGIELINCQGIVVADGSQFNGGTNYAKMTGILLNNCQACRVGGTFKNMATAVSLVNSGFCVVGPVTTDNVSGQNGNQRVSFSGSSANIVKDLVLYGGATYGIMFDGSSAGNVVVGGICGPGISTPVQDLNGSNNYTQFAGGGKWMSDNGPISVTSGTLGAGAVANRRYRFDGKTVYINFNISIPQNGSGGGVFSVGVPKSTIDPTTLFGRDNSNGNPIQGIIVNGTCSLFTVAPNPNLYPIVSGSSIILGGVYESV